MKNKNSLYKLDTGIKTEYDIEKLNQDIYELVSTNEKLEKLKEMVPEFNHNNIKEEKSGK